MNTPEVVFFYASVLLFLFHSIFVTYSLFKPHVFHSFVNALNFVIFRDHCPHRPSIPYLRLMLICGLLQGQMSSEQMNMCKHREKDDQKKNKQVLTTEQNGATKIAACSENATWLFLLWVLKLRDYIGYNAVIISWLEQFRFYLAVIKHFSVV